MRVLFAGRADSPILQHLREVETAVSATRRPLHIADPRVWRADFLVGHRYMHRVRPSVLDRFPSRAINLHNALLPWNRGLDAILWSFVDGTPQGVTIHRMDAGLDTGDILAQRPLHFRGGDTLRTVYAGFEAEMLALFREHWPAIRTGDCPASAQPAGAGTRHFGRDRQAIAHHLADGWDTPVSALTGPAPVCVRRAGERAG